MSTKSTFVCQHKPYTKQLICMRNHALARTDAWVGWLCKEHFRAEVRGWESKTYSIVLVLPFVCSILIIIWIEDNQTFVSVRILSLHWQDSDRDERKNRERDREKATSSCDYSLMFLAMIEMCVHRIYLHLLVIRKDQRQKKIDSYVCISRSWNQKKAINEKN